MGPKTPVSLVNRENLASPEILEIPEILERLKTEREQLYCRPREAPLRKS